MAASANGYWSMTDSTPGVGASPMLPATCLRCGIRAWGAGAMTLHEAFHTRIGNSGSAALAVKVTVL